MSSTNLRIGLFLFLLGLFGLSACDGDNKATDGDISDGDGLAECTFSDECPEGQFCLGGYCENPSDGDYSCLSCRNSNDCPAGSTCEADPLEGQSCCKVIDETDGDGTSGEIDWETEWNQCPLIKVDPTEIPFGAVSPGATVPRSVTICNDANSPKATLDVWVSYNEFTYTDEFIVDLNDPDSGKPYVFPQRLERGDCFSFNVTYRPTDDGKDEGYLSIISNDCEEPNIQLRMYSDYKGTAFIEVDPSDFEFENVDLGSEPLEQDFVVKNIGAADGNKMLTLTEILFAGGYNDNFTLTSGVVDPFNPVLLAPNRTHTFTVQYSPQLKTDFDPHTAEIYIVNSSDDPLERSYPVMVSGWADSETLSLSPMPVDFGLVYIDEDGICMSDDDCPGGADGEQLCNLTNGSDMVMNRCYAKMPVTIHNWSGAPVKINTISPMEGVHGSDCGVFATTDATKIEVDDKLDFTAYFSPDVMKEHKCTLVMNHRLPGNVPPLQFPIKGFGRPPNKCPKARISNRSHGDEIVKPITGVTVGDSKAFYGDISLDEDYDLGGKLIDFSWNMTQFPEGSIYEILPIEVIDGMNVNILVTFDKPGDYELSLTVTDNDNCTSEVATVNVTVNGNQALRGVLDFDGGSGSFAGQNLVDMDIVVCDPNGACCSDDNIASGTNSCKFSRNYGSLIMPRWSTGAGFNGSVEEFRLPNALDGIWVVEVRYVNDCRGWYDFLVVPFCGAHLKNNYFTVKLYDFNDWTNTQPLYELSGTLTEGNRKAWAVPRIDGIWQEPQPY